MSRLRATLISMIIFLAALISATVPSFALELITQDEAKLPPQKGAIPNSGRGITRGPKILVPNDESRLLSSPIRFQVKFQTYGGSHIDLNALKVTYLKTPVVDLTARIKPFVLVTGIDIPDAQLPPGEHLLRIDVKDSEGRPATLSFLLKIAP